MPVSATICGGMLRPGSTSVASSPSTAPPRTLTAPISVMASWPSPLAPPAGGLEVHDDEGGLAQRDIRERVDVSEAELAHALTVGTSTDSRPGCHAVEFVGGRRYRADNTDRKDGQMAQDEGTVKIDCDDCAVRGPGCQDCVVSVLLGVPETLLDDERQALEVLADVGIGAATAAGADPPARQFRGRLTTRTDGPVDNNSRGGC